MFKNTTGQKWVVFAFYSNDETTGTPGNPVTGDAANITANLRIDGGAANAVDDTNPTELEDGYYIFDLTQAETNGDHIVICPESSTANVIVVGVPGAVYTTTDVSGVEAKIDTVDTVADGIKAVTDNLPNSGALTDLAAASALATVDSNVDAILVDTGTTLPAALSTIDTNVDSILADTGTDGVVIASGQTVATTTDVTNQVSANVTAISGSSTAADNLEASALRIVSGAAVSGTLSTTQMSTDLTEATNDHYNGRIIIWTSGVLENQATDITDYNGSTKVLTYSAVTEAPGSGDTFIII